MQINIDTRKIGSSQPCFIVAEAGINHNGREELAFRLIDAAARAKADAVKFQSFLAHSVTSDKSQARDLKKLELSYDEHVRLSLYCQKKNIRFISTPFDEASVDMLDKLNVSAYKVGSGEITNLLLLRYIATKKKPIILSTGMSFLHEVDTAINNIRGHGCDEIVLLHCTSSYPAKIEDANLLVIKTLSSAFDLPVGYSDHTLGTKVSLAAVAMGACVIEKHLTLDKTLSGPDHQASLEPYEFELLVKKIRETEKILGTPHKTPTGSEFELRYKARRSLIAAIDIPKNTKLTSDLLSSLRPAKGISSALVDLVIGCKTNNDLIAGQLIEWEHVRPSGL